MINKIKNNWYLLSILSIILFAALIRFFQFAQVPHGMTWDEAAIGYNGFAVFNTRRDEWLIRLPVSFMSFGDFKAPLAIYVSGIFTYLFGLNLFAVRLPFGITSLFAVLGMILLTQEIFDTHRFKRYYALFAGFIMALSPWHIHYSRAGFESGMALAFTIWGIYLLIKFFKVNFKILYFGILSVVFFSASIYTYHSSKVTVPLIGFTFIIFYFKKIKKHAINLIIPMTLFVVSLIPFIKDSLWGDGLTRAGVTIFSADISFFSQIKYIINSFIVHLSPNFLIKGATTTLRHGTGYLGVLFLTTLILFIAGLIYWLVSLKDKPVYQTIFILLIIFGILPAAISMEVPHSNRALLALPGFIITAVFGFDYIIKILEKTKLNKMSAGSKHEKNIVIKLFVGMIIAAHILFSISFINYYFTEFSKTSAVDFNDGYIEAFEIAKKYEKGEGVEPVDKIIFTSNYGQPYIFAIFVRKTNPIWYRGGSLIKYEFHDKLTINDLNRHNALIVGSISDDLPIEDADYLVYGSDGSVRFKIFRTNK
jgi:hypothetical protein